MTLSVPCFVKLSSFSRPAKLPANRSKCPQHTNPLSSFEKRSFYENLTLSNYKTISTPNDSRPCPVSISRKCSRKHFPEVWHNAQTGCHQLFKPNISFNQMSSTSWPSVDLSVYYEGRHFFCISVLIAQ